MKNGIIPVIIEKKKRNGEKIMSRVKTFFKYAIWIILFFILSEFLITVGLNSSYRDIKRKDSEQAVEIKQAQATLVNGRVKGTIRNSEQDYLTGKYVKIEFYSKRDSYLGKKYIPIQTTQATTTQDFSLNFELEDVKSYEVSIVDKKEEGEIELLPKEWTKPEIILATIATLLIFW